MLSYQQALRIVIDAGQQARLACERLPLDRALDRVLADDVRSRCAVPAFDNSAMDGFAIHAADASVGRVLREIGAQWAGASTEFRLQPGCCVRITTGAMLPAETERVVPKENAVSEPDGIRLLDVGESGAHIRRAGEDIGAEQALLSAGTRLDPPKLAALASAGIEAVNVIGVPRVAVLTTGDELRSPGEVLGPGQIYDSNRVYLQCALRELGLQPTGWPAVKDEQSSLQAALQQLTESFDVVICCGGVSAGERDLLPAVLEQMGELLFWKVRIKPGMPVLLARVRQALVCGLPGNPVSVLATFQQLVVPLLRAMRGLPAMPRRLSARLQGEISKRHARAEFMRGRAWFDPHKGYQVEASAATGSHRLIAAAQCNCLIVLPEGAGHWADASEVEISPWDSSL